MPYLPEERETNLNFDFLANRWRAWSTVSAHISKILEIGDVIRVEKDADGTVRAVDAYLTDSQVRLFKSKGPSEKQLEAARNMGLKQQKKRRSNKLGQF